MKHVTLFPRSLPTHRDHGRVVRLGLALAAALTGTMPFSSADVVGTTGGVQLLDPAPASVVEGVTELESNTIIHAFAEQQDVVLAAPLAVDVSAAGVYGSSLSSDTIPAGTVVSSYFLHSDQVGTSGSATFSGSISFDEIILGIILTDANLDLSDGVLGVSTYPYGVVLRGLEATSGDVLAVSGKTVELNLATYFVVDQCRIITGTRLAFSIDIASDCEYMSPTTDGNESFDAGHVYYSDASSPPASEWDDADLLGWVSFGPEGPWECPYGFVTPPPPGPMHHGENFDLDGYDRLNLSLEGLLPGPIYASSRSAEESWGIHTAENLMISYDDDPGTHWAAVPGSSPCDPTTVRNTPTNDDSPAGNVYGEAMDEVISVELNVSSYPATTLATENAADEVGVHADLAPNPSGGNDEDDDVDALDWLSTGDYRYFSADSEGVGGGTLVHGAIYLTTGGGPVVSPSDLGLADDVDIDAFEFAWLRYDLMDQGSWALALLFSTDDDDPQTTDVLEDGGKDPATIYASFMDGTHFELVTMADDVDAIAVLPGQVLTGSAETLCAPAAVNSSGHSARIRARGSFVAALNSFRLRAVRLPVNNFGYFLVSRTPSTGVTPPGSQGVLCLGGSIGRLRDPVLFSGPNGTFGRPVDITALPLPPPNAVLPGDTWTFQCWFRDNNPGPTSNFTNAVSVTFE